MIGPLGRLGAAATLGQHCPQVTQRPGSWFEVRLLSMTDGERECGAWIGSGEEEELEEGRRKVSSVWHSERGTNERTKDLLPMPVIATPLEI